MAGPVPIDTAVQGDLRYKAERDRFVALAFCWADILFEVDDQSKIVFAAGATKPILGRGPDELAGQLFGAIVAPPDVESISQVLKRARRDKRIEEADVRMAGPHASIPMRLAGYCLAPEAGNLYLGLRIAGGDRPRTESAPRETGLPDSASFAARAAATVKHLKATGQDAEVTLVALAGAEELQSALTDEARLDFENSVTTCLRANSLGGDSVTRIGEGRFGLIHAAGTDIGRVLEQIEDVTRRVDPTGQGAKVESATIKPGEAANNVSEENLARGLLYALHQFRDASGDSFSVKSLAANMNDLVGKAVDQVSAFREMVRDGKFHVALQPIVNARTGEIHHYEALCRFDANAGESPFKIITFAEETGLVHEFDLAICGKVIEWLSQFPRNSDRQRVAVNVSGHSIGVPSYLNGLKALLREHSWTRGKLMFEITESSEVADLAEANRFIKNLREWGYEVCLDDFGAGSASFRYLSALEVDTVKVDGAAVKSAMQSPKGRAFLSALMELCRRMNVETVAEMIDDLETLTFVRDCGCEYVQGYLFGRPSANVRDFAPLPNLRLFQTGGIRQRAIR